MKTSPNTTKAVVNTTQKVVLRGDGRTLWRAKLWSPQYTKGKGQEFLFREGDEAIAAMLTATDLAKQSPGVQMVGSVIVGVERVAKLWN